MNGSKYDFAVFGGDLRQWYFAELLSQKGYSVITYGIENLSDEKQSATASSLKEAVLNSEILVGPIPFTKNRHTIHSKISKSDFDITHFEDLLQNGQMLAAGCLSDEICQKCIDKGVSCFDFMKDNTVVKFNSTVTAEGAIVEALLRSPVNLPDSECLVLGFGKCATALAQKLQALSAKVTVCARKKSARTVADTEGFDTIDFLQLTSNIGRYQYIFNTVPSIVCSKRELEQMNEDAVLIDIASAPGGVDYRAASELDRVAVLCLGLPGKYAPKSSAEALINALLNQIQYKNVQ